MARPTGDGDYPGWQRSMGSPLHERGCYEDETPHPVRIGRSFAMSRYEVMFHEYDRFASATGDRCLPIRAGTRPAR